MGVPRNHPNFHGIFKWIFPYKPTSYWRFPHGPSPVRLAVVKHPPFSDVNGHEAVVGLLMNPAQTMNFS